MLFFISVGENTIICLIIKYSRCFFWAGVNFFFIKKISTAHNGNLFIKRLFVLVAQFTVCDVYSLPIYSKRP
jgi:hypothetical protein